ncbi:uncharacterized protein LAESUDRAFT_722455 [Laetiporus sulphureus 93-53]|uniref:N-terminal of MaoC-like dehydratase domain-containing protein n=1 Tax=Laetiporus sulphureus 93-53 TaxID=1314785 RepID=A0A165FW99_9APHY|nr:uncharacterized protein LAESUDRAFT_722455 [Laetiporus sulphureus 93-53]KZT09494.1 hypothetical protein LAESUDRAFT_722455 [Laetiporus sulphureus 93-53]
MSIYQRRIAKYARRRVFRTVPPRRSLSAISGEHIAALDRWIYSEKRLIQSDSLRPEHLSDLFVTLPTRNGTARPPEEPDIGAPLGYGHHLVFFHPRNPERALRADGTDQDFCPPEPFTRRMWAGGRMVWKDPLLIGENATATSTIESVEKRGFKNGSPMVFVTQNIAYRKQGTSEIAIEEERSHVYLAAPGNRRGVKEAKGLPITADYRLEYLPSATMLFRFSALTFNGHRIHLDRDFAQLSEGYPERLVHGPLTALMLLEGFAMHSSGAPFKSFVYRAINPMMVNRHVAICGAVKKAENVVQVWAEDVETKVVGMVGTVYV